MHAVATPQKKAATDAPMTGPAMSVCDSAGGGDGGWAMAHVAGAISKPTNHGRTSSLGQSHAVTL
eukprot:729549-Prymnesium_polylepis.2